MRGEKENIMKKKIIALIGVLVLTASLVTGCKKAEKADDISQITEPITEEKADDSGAAASESEETNEAENNVGIANPWVVITEDQAKEQCVRLFKAPDGAKVREWSMCEDLGDPDRYIGPLVQLSFELDGLEFTARAQQGAAEDTDIAGNYVEWTVGPQDVTLANWGGGHMEGKTYRSINDTGYVDQITWYDIEIGISYSLSVAAADLDGFDIQAIAEQMYSAENEPFMNIPDDPEEE